MSESVRPHRRQPTRLLCPWDSPGKNTGVGCHFLLQCMKVKVKLLSRARLLATPWTAAHQAPLPMRFSRQEYWSGMPLPSLPGMALTDPRGPWVGWADDWEGPEAQRPRARPQVTGSGPQPRWGPAQSYPLLWSSALPAPQGGLDWALGGGAKKRGLGEVGSKDHSSSPLHSVPARSQVVPG